MLVNFNNVDCLRDLSFPCVGRDQNTIGHPGRVGLWVAGQFRWLHDDSWEWKLAYQPIQVNRVRAAV